ncbi:hypothetical protein ACFV3E_29315 [Streptomyces sp. NPDC059718]
MAVFIAPGVAGERYERKNVPAADLSLIRAGSASPAAFNRSAAELHRDTVDVTLRAVPVPHGATFGPGARSSAPDASTTPRRSS